MRLKDEDIKHLMVVGGNLRAFRLLRNEDTKTVARAMKITPTRLHRIEKGANDTDVFLLLDLCHYYKADPKVIFNKESE